MEAIPPVKRITLLQKLIVSYAAISLFTLAALAISYAGLYSLNKTARDIVTSDFTVINYVTTLRESLLAQQTYAAKFSILKGAEYRDLYVHRETEFLEILALLEKNHQSRSIEEVTGTYRKFRKTADTLFKGSIPDTPALKSAANSVAVAIEKVLTETQRRLSEKLEAAEQREHTTVRVTMLLSLAGLLFAISVAALLIVSISTAVGKLKKATHRIAEGDFDFDPGIPPGDEVGDLAQDFSRMAKRLKELEQISLDASPLTRLPGNIAIERVLEQGLGDGQPFAVCYADLDNFKSYNDRYGYIRGSDLIKATGEIIYNTVNEIDNQNSFVGHIGGDDFVMVVAPGKADEVCRGVIAGFEKKVPEFYSAEDRAQGGFEGMDRYGELRSFPIMTISIAIVICQKGTYDSAGSIAKAAAELKDYLKEKTGSNYSTDRRSHPR